MYKSFKDDEGDTFVWNCNDRKQTSPTTTSATWTNVKDDPAATPSPNITIYGDVPPNNVYAGTYVFTCILKDIYLNVFGDAGTTHVFTMNIIKKPDLVVTGGISDQIFRLPYSYFIVMAAPLSSDVWSLPYSKTLYLNDTVKWTSKLYGDWIYWDEST